MVEADPWWNNVKGPFPESYGCVGVKHDGGGSMAGHGLVGPMRLHRAVNRRDMSALVAALDAGDNVNEVEGVRGATKELRNFASGNKYEKEYTASGTAVLNVSAGTGGQHRAA